MKYDLPARAAPPPASPPSRGAWIEISGPGAGRGPCGSPPSRGAWIEIAHCGVRAAGPPVAPLAGGVD